MKLRSNTGQLVLFWCVALTFSLLAVRALLTAADDPQERPTPQVTLPCRIVSVHDGDTLTADVTVRVNVRLLECYAPELSTPGGLKARDVLIGLAQGRQGVVSIPVPPTGRLTDMLTFGRVLGHVWVEGQDRPVSAILVERKLATKTKEVTR